MSKEIFLDKFHRNERVVFLSDGVFAIVLTLLVLELRVPQLDGDISATTLWHTVLAMKHNFLSFLLSFMFISSLWFTHNQLFKLFEKVDNVILWLNNLLLLMVCIIPFPTALIGQYFDNPVGIIILGSIWVITPLIIFWMATRAYHHNYLSKHVDLVQFLHLRKIALLFSPLSAIPLLFAWYYPSVAFGFYMARTIFSIILVTRVKVKMKHEANTKQNIAP
ncbi:MAG: TMEM175 family protein [Ginsengibacter sp.]